MKAAVLVGKEKFEVREMKKPCPSKGEVSVKVRACAICGSDLRIFHGTKSIDTPITGHEISGTVEEVGEEAKGILVEDRVVIETVIGCGECQACRKGEENRCLNKFKAIGYQYNGGFAQFIIIPREAIRQGNIIKIPGNISFEEASIVEPLSCVLNGWEPFKKRPKGFTTVVIGAGPVGLLHAEYAKSQSSKVTLVNRTAPRLELANRIGFNFDDFIDASKCNAVEQVRKLTEGLGADVVICAASSKGIQEQALEMAAVDADVSFFAGISRDDPNTLLDTNLIHYNELHVHGANSSNRKQYLEAVELISLGKINVKKFITHRFPLNKIEEAMRTLEDRNKNALKIVVDPWM